MFSYQCVLCLTDLLVNYLLNAFAICVDKETVFSLKVIVLFLCCDRSVCLGVPSICLMCVFV